MGSPGAQKGPKAKKDFTKKQCWEFILGPATNHLNIISGFVFFGRSRIIVHLCHEQNEQRDDVRSRKYGFRKANAVSDANALSTGVPETAAPGHFLNGFRGTVS